MNDYILLLDVYSLMQMLHKEMLKENLLMGLAHVAPVKVYIVVSKMKNRETFDHINRLNKYLLEHAV